MEKIKLAANCTIFSTGGKELRIRKGIWNYEEAVLSTDGISDALAAAIAKLVSIVEDGVAASPEEIENEYLSSSEDKQEFNELLEALVAQRFFVDEEESIINNMISDLIGGTFAFRYHSSAPSLDTVLLVTDNKSSAEYCHSLAKDVGITLETMTLEEMNELSAVDLTTRFDGIKTESEIERLTEHLAKYKAIAVVLSTPYISLLRNLNRIAIRNNQMISYAMIDGPFLTAFSIKPKETGCFECFENRILARIENLSVYRQFTGKVKIQQGDNDKKEITPLLNTFASLPIFETFLYTYTGKAKLSGRVLNVFIPSLEIQVQDLLRMPSCPACGFVAESQLEEIYTSTKLLVDGLVQRVQITD